MNSPQEEFEFDEADKIIMRNTSRVRLYQARAGDILSLYESSAHHKNGVGTVVFLKNDPRLIDGTIKVEAKIIRQAEF